MSLNPRQFFHGSTADLKPGDLVLPAQRHGGARIHPHLPKWRESHTWITPSEEGAWSYADQAEWHHSGNDLGSSRYSSHEPGHASRGRVFEVEPISAPEKRRRLSPHDPEEYTVPAARVKRVIDIPPPQISMGAGTREIPGQGQLPLQRSWRNWNRLVKLGGREASINENWRWAEQNMSDEEHRRVFSDKYPEPKKPHEHPGQGRLF